ncbi:MAG: hypothetical protein KDA22_11340 [Phycisphaerales bacterium]|nr:hypothetical protein [Phycisphaerales bacterium]
MTEPRPTATTITLRALEGEPLRDERIRDMVIAAAHALAERNGVVVVDLQAEPDRIVFTLLADRLVAMGFAAELRRITTAWYTGKFGLETLWGEPGHD